MSTTIDQRVVEMRFNNAQFESGARTTMSTLDKLKAKLNFTGASKGLEHLGQSANRVNMNGLNSAIDTAHSKFSALEVMGVTALANITNSAVNAGKRMLHALTVAPVTDGWKEYELTMNTIQTICNSTGKSADEVKEKLKDLDEYADRTVYSTADMFNNIYKFTNAGIDLDTASKAMIGIANATADAGQGAQQASIAYYNLAQSLSSGFLTTLDYKSLNGANILTVDLKQRIVDTAVEAGTLKKVGDDLYKSGNSVYNMQQLYTDALSDQWATADTLMKVFGEYADETTEIGNRAYKAATEVKTFSAMMESLKASAGTGWKETWQIIFGDLDDAKAFWTRLSTFIGGIISKVAEIRNNFLAGFLKYNPFDKLKGIFDKLDNSGIGKVAKKIDGITRSLEEYQKVVRNVWRGNYNNRGDNPDRFDLLRKEGWNPHVVQTLVNKGSKYKLTVEDITAAEKKWGVTSAESAEQVTETVEELSDAKLKEMGLTKEEIKLYRQLEEESRRTGKSIQELMDEMSKQDGRTLLIESLANIGKSLAGIFKAVYQALADVFAINPVGIYWAIKAFHDFTQRLVMSEDTADNLKRTLRGLFSIIGFVTDILGGGLKLVLKVIYKVLITVMDALGFTASSLLEYTAAIGDAIYNTRQWLKENSLIAKTIEVLVPIIMKAVVALMNWVSQNERIQSGLAKAKNVLKSFKDAYMNWLEGLKETDNVPKYIIEGLVKGLKKGLTTVGEAIINVGKFLIESFCKVLHIESPSKIFMALGAFIISGLLLGLTKGEGDVVGFIKGLGEKLIGAFKSIDFGKILAVGLGVGSFAIVFKLSDAISNLMKPLAGLGDMFTDVGKGVRDFAKGFKAISKGIKAKLIGESIKSIAVSVLILAGALFIISKIDPKRLDDCVKAILAMIVAIGAIALIASQFKNVNDFGKSTLSIVGITAALLLAAIAMQKLGSLNPQQMETALGGLAGIFLAILALVLAAGKITNSKFSKNVDKVGIMLFKIGGALILLAFVMKLMGKLSITDILKGTVVIGLFSIFCAYLIAVSKLSGEHADKAGKMISKISFALLMMVFVMKLSGSLSAAEFGKGIAVMALFGIFCAALISISWLAGQHAAKAGAMILMISFALLTIVGVMKIAGTLSKKEMEKGLGVLAAFMVFCTLLVAVSTMAGEHAMKAGVMLLLISGALVILTGVIFVLSKMDGDGVNRAVGIVSLLMVLFAGLIAVTHFAKDSIKTLVVVLAGLALLIGAVALLTRINPTKLAIASACIDSIMLSLGALILSTSKMKINKSAWQTFVPLMGMIAILAGAVILLAQCDPENAIAAAGGLSMLMLSLAGTLILVSKFGQGATKGIGAMYAMVGVVALLALIIGLLSGINAEQSMAVAKILTTMLIAMTLVLAVLTLLGMAGPAAIIGVGSLAVLVLVVGLIGEIFIKLGELDVVKATGIAQLMVAFLLGMSVVLAVLTVIGLGGPAALIGIGSLVALIVAMGALVTAIGWLMEEFPQLEEFLNKGIPILEKIGYALGSFIGNIIGGALSKISDSLPNIGKNLGMFMINATPFIVGARLIDEKTVNGIKCLSSAVLVLTAAKLIDGITSFITNGSSFATLGTELSSFINNAADFSAKASTIDPSIMTGVKALAEAILILTAADVIDGIANWITGGESGDSLVKFAEQLVPFGTALVSYGKTVKGINAKDIEGSATAAKKLVDVSKAVPNQGGLLAKITGDNDLKTFAENLKPFGTAMKQYGNNVKGINAKDIEGSATAAKKLVEVAKAVPNEGGLVSKVTGDNDLGKFAGTLLTFGSNLKTYGTNVQGLNTKSINQSVTAAESILSLYELIPAEGGFMDKLKGTKDLAGFVEQIKPLGEGLKSFSISTNGITAKNADHSIVLAGHILDVIKYMPTMTQLEDKLGTDEGVCKFVEYMDALAHGIKVYSEGIGGIDTAAVANSSSAYKHIRTMIEDMNSLKTDGVEPFGKAVKSLGKMKIASVVKAFDEIGRAMVDTGKSLVVHLTNGIKEQEDVLKLSSTSLSKTAVSTVEKSIMEAIIASLKAINATQKDYYAAGMYAVEGFAKGIKRNKRLAQNAGSELGRAALEAAKKSLDENSPSKEFYKVGDFGGQGFVNALLDNVGNSYDAGYEMADKAKNGLRNAISRISDIINSDIDSQPTIRPVLDLTDVKAGAGTLSSMFNNGPSIGVASHLRAISSGVNAKNQNGDVVGAIDKLRKEVGNVGGTTNNFSVGNVNYSADSDVADAIRTIIRATTVEGRS